MKARGATAHQDESASNRDRLVQEYDKLIGLFGEDPFRQGAVCQSAEGLSKVADEFARSQPKEKHELLKNVTEKSLRCAQLIEKALEAAHKLKALDQRLAKARDGREHADADDDEDMGDADEDADEDSTVLLLKDLINASEQMHEANKTLAQVGIVTKSTTTSRHLLSAADELVQSSLAGLGQSQATAMRNEFRDLYTEEFTSAFGDELDQFRHEDRFDSKDVSYLISCIQAGADVFTPLQQKLFVESTRSTDNSTK